MVGSFHHVSVKHLPLYLAEFDSRFNSRRDDSGDFFTRIVRQSVNRRLPLRRLVG